MATKGSTLKPWGVVGRMLDGGGGSNAVSRMFKDKLPVVEYFSVNTDAQHLFRCDVSHRLAIGQNLTRGLGAGANPDLGRQAAEESRDDIAKVVVNRDAVLGADTPEIVTIGADRRAS